MWCRCRTAGINLMFAYVEGGGVKKLMRTLPVSLAGVSLAGLDEAQLAALGILPVVDVTAAPSSTLMKRAGPWNYTIFEDRVEAAREEVVITLSEAKKLKLIAIAEALEAAMTGGVVFAGHTWATDDDSRDLLTAVVTLINAGQTLPPGFVWRTASGTPQTLTTTQLQGLLRAIVVTQYAAREAATIARLLVKNAITVAQVGLISV
jgi:hypothetical protein